jgi:NAD-dependent SIR2 family protein deacetylase
MEKFKLNSNRTLMKLIKRQNRQIVVLLGAGAAFSWGGVKTKELRNIFIYDKTFEIKGETVGKYLFDVLDNFFGSTDTNFETFIAVLEEIMNYIIDKTHIPLTSHLPSIFDLTDTIETLFNGKNEDEKREYSYELFRHYVNLVIEEIDKYNVELLDEKYSQINSNLVSFIKFFLNRGYSVKFYTTNYDNLIPQILTQNNIKVYEGLNPFNISNKRFNFKLNCFRKARVSHFNIHGSIFLRQIINQKYETVYSDSKQILPSIALPAGSGNPSERLLFSPIITGYKKTQRMVDKPFNLGFSALTNDLNDCKGLVTIGYSFSDPHINSILSSFTSWDKAKFLHVSWFHGRNFSTTTNKEDFNLDYYVTPIDVPKENDIWIHDKSERKHIFKKGFEEFLSNRENWKYLLS